MADMILGDSLVRDLLEDAVDPGQHGGLAGSAARLEAATPVLAAVSPLTCLCCLYMAFLLGCKRYSVVVSHVMLSITWLCHGIVPEGFAKHRLSIYKLGERCRDMGQF